jgi:branched-chain amino acid transport system ATP-binding protein
VVLLEIDGLRVRYGAIRALDGISLFLQEGEIVTIIGANGAGKSTTLRAISGLVPVEEGTVKFQGTSLKGLPAHRIARMGIAHVPEGRHVFPNLTVLENLLLATAAAERRQHREAIERVFHIFPRLRERAHQLAGTLSGGEQQMLAVGRALVTGAKLLLLDEPSMGLAPVLVEQIFGIIQEINRAGTSILLVEQNAYAALQIAHRGYVLETGRIVLSGSAGELRDNPEVKAAYLGR